MRYHADQYFILRPLLFLLFLFFLLFLLFLLFVIYIDGLDDNITSKVLSFTDDTKVFRRVNTDGNKQHLQNDRDK